MPSHLPNDEWSPAALSGIRVLLALALGAAGGWATLALGGFHDESGRMGIALGLAVFTYVFLVWRRPGTRWPVGLAGAIAVGAIVLVHYWTRLGHLP